MKITIKQLREEIECVNDYVLKDTLYRIRMQRHSGYYWLYLHTEDDRRIRTLFAGNVREINAYLIALEHKHWYMQNPF